MRHLTGGLVVATALLAAPAQAQDARAVERDLMAVIERTSKAFVLIGGGSGVIVSPEGDILTNDHVAGTKDIGKTWVVRRPGGVIGRAKMIGKDPRGDIALLRMEGEGPFPYVELADSDGVVAGDAVVALGNPFGLSKDGSPHVTLGVVSAVHRFRGGYSDAIQTDTAINPGNSGGPLLDLQGRLIGINGQIGVRFFGIRANTGVGYAIPSNQIKEFLPQFRAKGVVHHGVVAGVLLRDTPAGGEGALVERVNGASVAAQRGLKAGDVIVEAGGRAVTGEKRFQGIVGTYPEGAAVPLVVRRGQETVRLEVTLDPHPRDDDGRIEGKGAYLGVTLTPGNSAGAEVNVVVAGSPAQRAGLLSGDVIKAVAAGEARHAVNNARDLLNVLARFEPGTAIRLEVLRGEQPMQFEVTLGRRPAE